MGINRRRDASRRSEASASARAIAFDVLRDVLDRRRPLEQALEAADIAHLESRDRAFLRLLAATTLRQLGRIDAAIDLCLERPLPRRGQAVRTLLRMGICQLLFLETSPHAAVDTTVQLLAARGGEAGYKGLVNAVLRRVDREREPMLARTADPAINTPAWLWDSWVAIYGTERAKAIAAAHLREPPLDLTVKGDPAAWRDSLGATLLPTGSLRLQGDGRIESLPGFAEGAWWVQDAAAALPVRMLGDVCGKRVIDLCAAPGGKTAQLAAAGAKVIAVDRSESRMQRLRDNLARLDLRAETVVMDATAWMPSEIADAVLLDAPCSATGTIRRHPDVAWLKQPADIPKLTALQDRLLRAAVDMVRPGGFVVYCTCSLQPEEGANRIDAILQGGVPVERVPIDASAVAGQADLVTAAGDLRTLPCQFPEIGGIDGFFAARLRRR